MSTEYTAIVVPPEQIHNASRLLDERERAVLEALFGPRDPNYRLMHGWERAPEKDFVTVSGKVSIAFKRTWRRDNPPF